VFVAQCEDDDGQVVDHGPEPIVRVTSGRELAVVVHVARVAGRDRRREPI
jgi:hypothetical protein